MHPDRPCLRASCLRGALLASFNVLLRKRMNVWGWSWSASAVVGWMACDRLALRGMVGAGSTACSLLSSASAAAQSTLLLRAWALNPVAMRKLHQALLAATGEHGPEDLRRITVSIADAPAPLPCAVIACCKLSLSLLPAFRVACCMHDITSCTLPVWPLGACGASAGGHSADVAAAGCCLFRARCA